MSFRLSVRRIVRKLAAATPMAIGYAFPIATLVLATAVSVALAQAADPAAIHKQSCSTGGSWADAGIQAITPFSAPIMIIGIVSLVGEVRNGGVVGGALGVIMGVGMIMGLIGMAALFGAVAISGAGATPCG